MGAIDDIVAAFVDFVEFFDANPLEVADAVENAEDPTEGVAIILQSVQPADEAGDLLVDTAEEFVLTPLLEEDQITPDNVEAIQDEVEGNAAAITAALLGVTLGIETLTAGQVDELPSEVFQALTGLGFQEVAGREIDAQLQEGVDPALKQKVHRRTRSKQADFQDYVEGNLALRGAETNVQPRDGVEPEDLPDYLNPDDLGWLPDPDTYGTIPDQTGLFELDALKTTEPEELIEEPIQYGIPVPKLPVKQVTELQGTPKDAQDIYLQVIEELPKTENLIQDYVRLTEFNFRLREKIENGAITPEQAIRLVEPELRELIVNALPEDRYREEDRTADEVVDQLLSELFRNFQLLDSLPADPPSQADIESFFRRGVISSAEFAEAMDQFGPPITFFADYYKEQCIRQGPDDIQTQAALGRITESDADARLEQIGFDPDQRTRILNGADPDNILTSALNARSDRGGIPVSRAVNIGDVRSQQLSIGGIRVLEDLAGADIDTVTNLTDMNDEQAAAAIESAETLLEASQGS